MPCTGPQAPGPARPSAAQAQVRRERESTMTDVPVHEARVLFTPPIENDRWHPRGPSPVNFAGEQGLMWVSARLEISTRCGPLPGPRLHRLVPTTRASWRCVPGSSHRRPRWIRYSSGPKTCLGRWSVGWEFGCLAQSARLGDLNYRAVINDACVLPDGSGVVFGTRDLASRARSPGSTSTPPPTTG